MIEWLVLGAVLVVVITLLAAWVGEVLGLNDRLDAADEEELDGLCRIDQRRD